MTTAAIHITFPRVLANARSAVRGVAASNVTRDDAFRSISSSSSLAGPAGASS